MSRRRGRPSLSGAGLSPIVDVRLRPSDLAEVRAIATLHHTSIAAVVRHAVAGYLRQRRAAVTAPAGPPATGPRFPRSVTRRGAF